MKAMDLFGIALYDYHIGKYKGPFLLIDKKGNKFELNISEYFRNIDDLNILEKELFKNIKGKEILDIGCGTAFYFPLFEGNNVEGIDISKFAIKVAKENGIKNVRCENIFDKKIKKKYDNITLLGNNLSIGGDITGTKKFLKILKNILKKDGKILSIIKKEENNNYYIGEFICKYNNIKSMESFKWIRFNINFLKNLLQKQGLNLKILKEDNYGYCLEISHIKKLEI